MQVNDSDSSAELQHNPAEGTDPRRVIAESDLTTLRLRLKEQGYFPLPVMGKRPTLPNWPTAAAAADDARIQQWVTTGHGTNTGLLCGELVGVDIDVLDPVLAEKLGGMSENMLGPTPLRRVGNAPKLMLCYRAGEGITKMTTPAYTLPDGSKAQVEVLARGQQFVAFGTHPDTGQPYEWMGSTPETVPLADLGRVTVESLRKYLDAAEAAIREAGGVLAQSGTGNAAGIVPFCDAQVRDEWAALSSPPPKWLASQLAEIGFDLRLPSNFSAGVEAALPSPRMITPDNLWDVLSHLLDVANGSYGPWMKAMAGLVRLSLHRSPGYHWVGTTEECREITRKWSEQGESYNDRDFDSCWRSFEKEHSGRTFTFATVVGMARNNGFRWSEEEKDMQGPEATLTAGSVSLPHAVGVALAPNALLAKPRHQLPFVMEEADAARLINHEFLYAKGWGFGGGSPGIVRVMQDGQLQAISDKEFASMLANRIVRSVVNSEAVNVPAAKWWMNSRNRREYERVVYAPPGGALVAQNEYNLWRGFAVTPTPGDWSLMEDHLRSVICNGDPQAYNYLIRWMAYRVQFPGRPAGTMVILKGEEQGTGKTMAAGWLLPMFGQHGLSVTTVDALTGRFTDHLAGKSLVVANEVSFAGNRQGARMLKSMITDDTLYIEPKGRRVYTTPNTLGIIATTNDMHVAHVEGTDRRMLILAVSPHRKSDTAYFKALAAQANGGGVEAMLDDLLKVDLTGWRPQPVYQTAESEVQKTLSLDSVDEWLLEAASGKLVRHDENGGWSATHNVANLHQEYLSYCEARKVQRPVSSVALGLRLTKVAGASGGSVRSVRKNLGRQWVIPSRDEFAQAVYAALGLTVRNT